MTKDPSHKKLDIKKIQEEREEYLNGWKRAKADLVNYKREESERIDKIRKFCQEGLIYELLNVLDSFELALILKFTHSLQSTFPQLRG